MNFSQLLSQILFRLSLTHIPEFTTLKKCDAVHLDIRSTRDSEEPLCPEGEKRSGSSFIMVLEEKMSCHYVDAGVINAGH